MAWPTRSKLLAIHRQAALTGGAWQNLGGPAAGHVWLCKWVSFYNGTGITRRLYLRVLRGGTYYKTKTLDVVTDGGGDAAINLVLESGDTLEYAVGGANAAQEVGVLVCGALLG